MKYILSIILLIACIGLYAESMMITTPGGNIGFTVDGNSSYHDGKVTSSAVVDNIADKLQELDKSYIIKLNKMDQVRAKKLIDDIYNLLALLPANDQIAVTPAGNPTTNSNVNTNVNTNTSTSTSTAVNDNNMNININVNNNNPDANQGNDKPHGKPHDHHPQVDMGEEHVVVKPIAEKDFTILVNKVKAESFSDNQLRVIRTATKNANYNVDQIVRMMDLLTYSDDKIEALRIMYPKVTDPKNNYQILDALTYSTDKEKAEEIINQ
ncbi:MAG TPA: DUF4476 domain-containing protein [Candidatus Cloacimonadota bacterium]|nr:DUF4476 domain-containing protein [Candidatus Cloacimonadota bacterium]HPT71504.1 DUF4476 domain-containing protein [Candidatus Cloacimonadota bacterium]